MRTIMTSTEDRQQSTSVEQRLADLGVREEDLVERFVRASGPGGQKVNKTSSAVYLKHLPSGLEVKVQAERSQAQNRQLARRLLADRLEEQNEQRRMDEQQRRARLERRSRGRPRHVKRRMLESKRRRGEKKRLRGRVRDDD